MNCIQLMILVITTLKTSSEVLRALLTKKLTNIILRNRPPKFFLQDDSYLSYFEVSLNTKVEKVWNACVICLVNKAPRQFTGVLEWNSQTQA